MSVFSRRTAGRPGADRLSIDWTACDGRGLCAELLPEMVARDDWGYPVLAADAVPAVLGEHAAHAVRACPTMALRLRSTAPHS